MPSIVTTLRPASALTGRMHERVARPSMRTVQAPQRPAPQPNFAPVSPAWSRRYQRSGIAGSPSKRRSTPLMWSATAMPAARYSRPPPATSRFAVRDGPFDAWAPRPHNRGPHEDPRRTAGGEAGRETTAGLSRFRERAAARRGSGRRRPAQGARGGFRGTRGIFRRTQLRLERLAHGGPVAFAVFDAPHPRTEDAERQGGRRRLQGPDRAHRESTAGYAAPCDRRPAGSGRAQVQLGCRDGGAGRM